MQTALRQHNPADGCLCQADAWVRCRCCRLVGVFHRRQGKVVSLSNCAIHHVSGRLHTPLPSAEARTSHPSWSSNLEQRLRRANAACTGCRGAGGGLGRLPGVHERQGGGLLVRRARCGSPAPARPARCVKPFLTPACDCPRRLQARGPLRLAAGPDPAAVAADRQAGRAAAGSHLPALL